jgi:hypothetical protein
MNLKIHTYCFLIFRFEHNLLIDLSKYLDNTNLNETEVDALVENNGYLTAEVDADPENELQTLSISGDQLTISGKNTVTLPASSGGSNSLLD